MYLFSTSSHCSKISREKNHKPRKMSSLSVWLRRYKLWMFTDDYSQIDDVCWCIFHTDMTEEQTETTLQRKWLFWCTDLGKWLIMVEKEGGGWFQVDGSSAACCILCRSVRRQGQVIKPPSFTLRIHFLFFA